MIWFEGAGVVVKEGSGGLVLDGSVSAYGCWEWMPWYL